MKNKTKVFIGLGTAIALIIGYIWYVNSVPEVERAAVSTGTVKTVLEETGYTESVSAYVLESPKPARIVSVLTKIGQEVDTKDPLIIMHNLEAESLAVSAKSEISNIMCQIVSIKELVEPLNLQISQSESAIVSENDTVKGINVRIKEARSAYNRAEAMYKAGALSLADRDAAMYHLKSLEIQKRTHEDNLTGLQQGLGALQRQQARLASDLNVLYKLLGAREQTLAEMESDLIISSPTAGHVLELNAEAGQVVGPGSPLAKIGGNGMLQVKTDILSDDMADVREGATVRITAPVLGDRTIKGWVRQIYPGAVEKMSALGIVQRRVTIVIALEEAANLKPGYEVTVDIETARDDKVLRLPYESVRSTPAGGYEVMKIVRGRIVITSVNVGLKNQEWVEISDGLENGEPVVRDASLDYAGVHSAAAPPWPTPLPR